jgi:pimeloyl-ACP methyl ester carboxylesterase
MNSRARWMLGAAGFAAAAAGGVGFGLLARRRAEEWRLQLEADPEWAELSRPVPARAHTIASFDRTDLHVEVTGPDDAPPLVLIHGYALGLRSWHYQRRDLAADFRVIAYDLRGHGSSERGRSGDYSIATLGRDLAAVLDALVPFPAKALAAGHSLGGMSILSYAKEFPELIARRLAGAILLDTTGFDVVAGGLAATGAAVLSALPRVAFGPRTADVTTLITRSIGFGPQATPAQVAFVERLLIETPNSVKADLGPTLTASDLREAAPLLRVPSLVLVGEHDRLTPPAAAVKLARALPDARLVTVPGAGHNAMLEAADHVTDEIRAFARRRFAEAA